MMAEVGVGVGDGGPAQRKERDLGRQVVLL